MGASCSNILSCCIPRPSDPDYRSVAHNDDEDDLELHDYIQDNSLVERVPIARAAGSETSNRSDPQLLESIRAALAAVANDPSTTSTSGNIASSNDCFNAMKQALETMEKTDESAAVVLDELLKNERKRLTKAGKMAKINFAANMISMALEEKQQEELYEIFAGLPPSVLGDSDAKEASRVLLNVREDVRTAIAQRKLSVSRKLDDIYMIRDLFFNILKDRKDQEEILCRLIGVLEPSEASRTVMQNILLIKALPAEEEEREEILMDIFPQAVVERQLDKASHNASSSSS